MLRARAGVVRREEVRMTLEARHSFARIAASMCGHPFVALPQEMTAAREGKVVNAYAGPVALPLTWPASALG